MDSLSSQTMSNDVFLLCNYYLPADNTVRKIVRFRNKGKKKNSKKIVAQEFYDSRHS